MLLATYYWTFLLYCIIIIITVSTPNKHCHIIPQPWYYSASHWCYDIQRYLAHRGIALSSSSQTQIKNIHFELQILKWKDEETISAYLQKAKKFSDHLVVANHLLSILDLNIYVFCELKNLGSRKLVLTCGLNPSLLCILNYLDLPLMNFCILICSRLFLLLQHLPHLLVLQLPILYNTT